MSEGWLKRNGLLLLGFLVSLGLHAGLVEGLQSMKPPSGRRNRLVEMSVFKTPPKPKPEPAKALPPTPKPKPKVKAKPKPKPPPSPVSEKPTLEPKPEPSKPQPRPETRIEPPRLVAGLDFNSFGNSGETSAPTFGVGNTLMARPEEKMARPEDIKPKSHPADLTEITTEPVLIDRPSPREVFHADYPIEAKAQGIQGRTRVKLLIDEHGKVVKVKAIKGPALLRKAAEELAIRFRYKPAMQNRRPVAVWWFEDIPFRISD